MEAVNLIIGIIAAIAGIGALGFAYLAWRVSKPAAQWEIERMDVGRYKIIRTGLRPARIVDWDILHEGPPTWVSHASASVDPVLFKRGDSIHFVYRYIESHDPVPVMGAYLEVRGRELSVKWVPAKKHKDPSVARFIDLGRPRETIIMLD